jgi:hypothetical protein
MAKPATQARWSTDVGTTVEPTSGHKNTGWINERVPFQYLNWLFNMIYQWLVYFEDTTDDTADTLLAYTTAAGVDPASVALTRQATAALADKELAAIVNPSNVAQGSNAWRSWATDGAGLIVAVGASGAIAVSSNFGRTWGNSTAANGFTGTFTSVIYAGGLFVACGFSSGTAGVIQTSPDSINWTERVNDGSYALNVLAYDGSSMYVAVGQNGTLWKTYTSSNGTAWTSHAVAQVLNTSHLAFGAGLFVSALNSGASTTLYTSPDGITWTARAFANAATYNYIAYNAAYGFIAYGVSGGNREVQKSANGITWTRVRNGAGANGGFLAADASVYAAEGTALIADWTVVAGYSASGGPNDAKSPLKYVQDAKVLHVFPNACIAIGAGAAAGGMTVSQIWHK